MNSTTPQRLENVQGAIVNSTITAGGDVLVNGQKVTNYFYSAPYRELKKQWDDANDQFSKAHQRIEKYPDEEEFKVDLLRADEHAHLHFHDTHHRHSH